MDRFKLMPDGQLYASPPSASWLEICKNAHALWPSTTRLAKADRSLETDNEIKPTPLDWMGIAEGTDKSSLGGDYLRHYEERFGKLRDAELNLIEIGVLDGASLRMWVKFFSKAQIVGVDINPD